MNNTISPNKELYLKQLCESFINSYPLPRYIFGRNNYAKSVAELIPVDGFIDEYTSDDLFMGKPIIKNLAEVPQNAIVLSCIVGNVPVSIKRKIEGYSLRCLDYYSFLRFSNLASKNIEFWENFHTEFNKNSGEYQTIQSLLTDQKSKEIFERILAFRINYDLSQMEIFEDIQYRQYFEDFLELQVKDETFVDVGGFDGYTSLEFIKRCGQFKKIYFLEPESTNLNKAKVLLKEYQNIEYLEYGASNKRETLCFENEKGSASKVSVTGSIVIEADTLDNMIHDKVSYIKMDIEGSESIAIEGAKQTILKYHPRLAICVYHKANDLIDIPKQILAIRSDYDIYLRHYTEGVVETVMFFIPK